ncbi:putative endoribonuclease [Gloeomargarita lithophora Alchichica-D10]|uniref:Putative endoribonuclease n=1 Tax=Gloeomargarita lithophora Alchichica-D10 TaxID=1188229 RepID=A0A1J0AAF4_9CYAN|nr:RidA family protein [Gloeomargarita lithophora]APB32915.1 putative endoribonuclease [Gloeomargarita lithophora Alchichica-D10]
MNPQPIQTPFAPLPIGPYRQAIQAQGTLVFLSGQIPLDAQGQVVSDNVTLQTRQVMENLGAVLKAAGCDWQQVVKTTVYLIDLADFAAVNQVYGEYFPADYAPARACVQVTRLPKDVRVEIDAIAVLAPG